MSLRLTVAAALASTVGACTLFSGLDGFTSPPPGDATDAGAGADATPSPDGGSDAATPGTDASTTTDGAPPDARFCAPFSGDALCADFDDQPDPLFAWTKNTSNGATVATVTDRARSAPNGLRAVAGATAMNRLAYVQRSLTMTASHARLSYALYVEKRPSANEIEVNGLVFAGTNTSELYLAVNGTEAFIVEQVYVGSGAPTAAYHAIGSAIPSEQWLNVTLEVTLSGTQSLVMKVDGTQVANEALTVSGHGPGLPRVRAGITWANKDTTDASVVIDDVRFEVLP